MTLRRLFVALAILTCVEGALFIAVNRDLVYLSQTRARLADAPAATFDARAEQAMARDRLSRRHLETIADVSARRGDAGLNLRALERLAREYPADTGVTGRLADALRRGGRLEEAEALYRRMLPAPGVPDGSRQ